MKYKKLWEAFVIIAIGFIHFGLLRMYGFNASPVGSITTGIAVFLLYRYWQES